MSELKFASLCLVLPRYVRKRCASRLRVYASAIASIALFGCGGGGSSGDGPGEPLGAVLVSASAPSNHYVVATFSEPVDVEAVRAESYEIVGPESTLEIVEAGPGDAANTVLLTTESQQEVRYELTYQSSQSVAMTGSTQNEPGVETATSLNSTTVLLAFSEDLDDAAECAGDECARYYRIVARGEGAPAPDVGDVDVLNAEFDADDQTVLLTTTPQEAVEYEIKVTNVVARAGGARIDPTRNTASFFGIDPIDESPPEISDVQATSSTNVLVSFSEPVEDGAGDAASYEIRSCPLRCGNGDEGLDGIGSCVNDDDCGGEAGSCEPDPPCQNVVVVSAQPNSFGTQVLLTTLPLTAGANIEHALGVDGVADRAGNQIDCDFCETFVFAGDPGSVGGDQLPRVVGAASSGNTGVIVQFSKPMGNSAEVPGSYVIVQQTFNPEAGALAVTKAEFASADRLSVQLTTRSQNELTYELTVVNVTDLAGSPLAPRITSNGVLVDPTRATFPGTPPTCGPRRCSNDSEGMGDGLCAEDDDCTPCDGDCTGVCVDPCPDTDEDGLADSEEQRGWRVVVQLANGETSEREVTSDPDSPDTDLDGLDDSTEKGLGTDPRARDTDSDGLSDDEEFNVIFSDPLVQDTDGDGITDDLEVEFHKTNALLADSDGDGFTDSQELFEMSRDPRIADLPSYEIIVGGVRLQIDERFTFTDESGETQTESSSTETSLENDTSFGSSRLSQTVGSVFGAVEGGFNDCQSECDDYDKNRSFGTQGRARLIGTVGGMVEFTTASTTESATATMSAFQRSLEKARELSTASAVTREVVGASLSADVTLENPSDLAFRLSDLEVRVATTDPQDPTRMVPVATLLPDRTVQTGDPVEFNVGPEQTRGPVIFSNVDVFPSLVEDLMRAPRGLMFSVANFDQTTEDGRNFAFGLQDVRERTVNVSFDFGDGDAEEFHAITAGVLNRPRDELRCGPTGDHPDQPCLDDGDCGTSAPCEGGKVIGGFSGFGGTGVPEGTRLDFILQDILQMRKSTPAVILAVPGGLSTTVAQGDDVQVDADGVVVAPGRNGRLDTEPGGDDYRSDGPRIVAGLNGVAETSAEGDDVQVVVEETDGLAPQKVVIAPGANGVLDTEPDGDDMELGPDGILPGNDGSVQSVAQGDDVQLVPVATTGVPEDVVVITAGRNGILDTPLRGDDLSAVVTGYEVSRTCDANTPFAILAGRNQIAETAAESGICTIASPPHFVGESCDRSSVNPDAGCGIAGDAPTSVVEAVCVIGEAERLGDPCTASDEGCECGVYEAGSDLLRLADASGFPSSGVIAAGSWETRYSSRDGDQLTVEPLVEDLPAGTQVRLVNARCTADMQEIERGQSTDDPDAVVVRPMAGPGAAQFLVSVPGGDDVFVAPGIPCTTDADCRVDDDGEGRCNGPRNVVRVDNRRNGQFRRFWALLLPDGSQFQTDFGDILVRPGDSISLAFIQDIDRDGLIAQEEFLHRSSDFKKDTDDEGIGDFSEVRLGWDVGVVGQPLRRVFPDPSLRDSDFDGLSDKEEQDVRRTQCACNAMGPKRLLGSGRLLREPTLVGDFTELGAQPCTTDDDCGGDLGSCVDAAHCDAIGACPPCSDEVTLNRTDPRLPDTDQDGVDDAEEVYGYLTGPGIVEPINTADSGTPLVILAGVDREANTTACPANYCVEDADRHCMIDGDCPSHNCIHPEPCDDVQVVPPGFGVGDASTVVVAAGPNMVLETAPVESPGSSIEGEDILPNQTDFKAGSQLRGDDLPVVLPGRDSVVRRCVGGADVGEVCTRNGQCDSGACAVAECVEEGDFDLCGVIKPGPNGVIDSIRGGNDVIVPGGLGQKLEVSDPLSPDSDMDLISDGDEREQGSSPNVPGDAIFGGDLDQDGLTDVIETLGWEVQVVDAAGIVETPRRYVQSDPNLPDTDFDGLPDFAERNLPCVPICADGVCSNDDTVSCVTEADCLGFCPIDATRVDTDGDGLRDFDELSGEQFASLEPFADSFPGFAIDGTSSMKYGTDPTRADTDGDALTDREELLVGWRVVRADGSIDQVFSDPTKADTDGDGLFDQEERARETDPVNADTDGDGRLDGDEVGVGTDPLTPDIFVTVTYSVMQLVGPNNVGEVFDHEWRWRLSVQDTDEIFPGETLSSEDTDCRFERHAECCSTNRFNFFLNRSTAMVLTPGNGIVLNGVIAELARGRCDDPETVDDLPVDPECRMSFIDDPLTYDQLQGSAVTTRTFRLSDGDCSGLVVAEISVNCIGKGRGVCRVGNPCIADDDCASGSCRCPSSSGDDLGVCNGIGLCRAECGNGLVEFNPGSLSESEARRCLSGQAGVENCEFCDDGNADDCGTCDAACKFFNPEGPKTCESGTGCVDDRDCEGICAPGPGGTLECSDCSDGDCTGVCDDGACQPLCGNGIVEPGVGDVPDEQCDDGNDDDCGPCNSTCDGVDPTFSFCPGGTGCNDDSVCQSRRCVNGVCIDAVCGNGVVEDGEACDDGNAQDCGSCNQDCSEAVDGGPCPTGTFCNADDICLLDKCCLVGEIPAPAYPDVGICAFPELCP